jgi:hypothetical protein
MFMSIQEDNLLVNDYLDLYLYAGEIGDTLWQEEIIENLKIIYNKKKQPELAGLNMYLERFKRLNEEILSIYQQMRQQSSIEHLEQRIQELKQQRIVVGRQIRFITSQPS